MGTVTFNSKGTLVTGTSHPTLQPVPPISNCLGKMVFLVVAVNALNQDTIGAPSGATYYLLGKGAVDVDGLSVYYKNGEATEPTPSVTIGGSGFGDAMAQIFVLDIDSSHSFPTIAAAGDSVLATASGRGAASGVTYGALTVVGGGYAIQFGAKVMQTGTCTAIATTSGFTQTSFGGVNAVLGICAQLQNADTVLSSNLAANNVAITTCTDAVANTTHTLTVEMSFNTISVPPVTPTNPSGRRIFVLP